MSYGKNSNKRLVLLLVQFLVILYTLIEETEEAQILAFLVLTIWILAIKTWLEKEI